MSDDHLLFATLFQLKQARIKINTFVIPSIDVTIQINKP